MEKLVTDTGTMYEYQNGNLFKNGYTLPFINYGEEGRVFRDHEVAVKIYHKKPLKSTLNRNEIDILKNIPTKRIILPRKKVLGNKLRGYTMPFIEGEKQAVFDYSKEKLLHELKLIKEDLKLLGKNNVMIDDLRDSNYLCNLAAFYLIDAGDYSVRNEDCTDLNISIFSDFFLEDIIGMELYEIDDLNKVFDAYLELRSKLLELDNDISILVEEEFEGSINDEVKKLVKE